jgi:sec-independent protein translocase protein TatC
MKRRIVYQYDEDFFADTRMSFGDHIEDLRRYLLRALYGFLVGLIFGFIVAFPLLKIIGQPVEAALQRYFDERRDALIREVEADAVNHPLNQLKTENVKIRPLDLYEALRAISPALVKEVPAPSADAPTLPMRLQVRPLDLAVATQPLLEKMGKRPALTALGVAEAFVVYLKVAIVAGLVIASPWIVWQIWLFVAAGLYPHEKKYVYWFVPGCLTLFFGGIILCQIVVMPAAVSALLEFNKWLDIEPDFRLSEWLSFAIIMPLVTGICFQTPLVMMLLGKIGVFTAADFLSKWKICIFVMLIIAAVFSPSVDPFSLFILWLPMVALYFLGIVLVQWVEAPPEADSLEEEVVYVPAPASAQRAVERNGQRGHEPS